MINWLWWWIDDDDHESMMMMMMMNWWWWWIDDDDKLIMMNWWWWWIDNDDELMAFCCFKPQNSSKSNALTSHPQIDFAKENVKHFNPPDRIGWWPAKRQGWAWVACYFFFYFWGGSENLHCWIQSGNEFNYFYF